jgi:hypothetical protein
MKKIVAAVSGFVPVFKVVLSCDPIGSLKVFSPAF